MDVYSSINKLRLDMVPMRVRPVSVETGTWVIGAGIKYAQAIARGVEPRVMDVFGAYKGGSV